MYRFRDIGPSLKAVHSETTYLWSFCKQLCISKIRVQNCLLLFVGKILKLDQGKMSMKGLDYSKWDHIEVSFLQLL